MVQTGLLARPEIKVQDVREITATEAGVQPKARRLGVGDGTGPIQTALLGLTQRLVHAAQIDALTHRPYGVDKRQTRPIEPLLTEIESVLEAGQTGPHGAISNQQHGVGIDILGFAVQGKRYYLR